MGPPRSPRGDRCARRRRVGAWVGGVCSLLVQITYVPLHVSVPVCLSVRPSVRPIISNHTRKTSRRGDGERFRSARGRCVTQLLATARSRCRSSPYVPSEGRGGLTSISLVARRGELEVPLMSQTTWATPHRVRTPGLPSPPLFFTLPIPGHGSARSSFLVAPSFQPPKLHRLIICDPIIGIQVQPTSLPSPAGVRRDLSVYPACQENVKVRRF